MFVIAFNLRHPGMERLQMFTAVSLFRGDIDEMDYLVASLSTQTAHTFNERMAAVSVVEACLSKHPTSTYAERFLAPGERWQQFSGRDLGGDPRVHITDLASAAASHLNGRAGLILGRDPSRHDERLCVLLAGDVKVSRLKNNENKTIKSLPLR